jgi:hypothetical protein
MVYMVPRPARPVPATGATEVCLPVAQGTPFLRLPSQSSRVLYLVCRILYILSRVTPDATAKATKTFYS